MKRISFFISCSVLCILSLLMRRKKQNETLMWKIKSCKAMRPLSLERPKCDKSSPTAQQLLASQCVSSGDVQPYSQPASQPYSLRLWCNTWNHLLQNRLFLSLHTEFCHENNPSLISKMGNINTWTTSRLLHKTHFYQKEKLYSRTVIHLSSGIHNICT